MINIHIYFLNITMCLKKETLLYGIKNVGFHAYIQWFQVACQNCSQIISAAIQLISARLSRTLWLILSIKTKIQAVTDSPVHQASSASLLIISTSPPPTSRLVVKHRLQVSAEVQKYSL